MNTRVSSPVAATPVTIDDVKDFYLEYLVPVGQSLHLVAKWYDVMRTRMCYIGNFSTRFEFKRVGYKHYAARLLEEGFMPLHLVNCYLQSRQFAEGAQLGDRGLMPDLATILTKMRNTLCQPLFQWADCGPTWSEDVRAGSRAEMVSYPDNLTQLQQSPDRARAIARTTEMEDLILLQRTLHAQLYKVLGITPATQQAWVRDHVNPASPLTKGGRLASWRTLVNNLPWTGVARTLQLKETSPVTWLGSRAGREQVAALMAEAFAPGRLGALLGRPDGEKLPTGVSVHSTADGYLVVEGTFASRRNEVVMQLGVDVEKLTDVSEKLRAWLVQPESRVVARTVCSFTDMQNDTLSKEVRNAGRAVESANRQAAQAIEELQGHARKAHQSALLAKLNEQFSPEEIAEIAVALANRG